MVRYEYLTIYDSHQSSNGIDFKLKSEINQLKEGNRENPYRCFENTYSCFDDLSC